MKHFWTSGLRHLVFLGAMAASGATLDAATVAYWRFEEGTAGTPASGTGIILDSSGNGHDGTPNGGPAYSGSVPANQVPNTGVANVRSMEFSGNQRITVPDDTLFQLTHSLTIEAYINLFSYPTQGVYNEGEIVFRGDNRPGLDPYFLEVRDQNVLFNIDSGHGAAYLAAPLPGLNQWVHVAGTLDDTTGQMRLYINGQIVADTVTPLRPFGALDSTQYPSVQVGSWCHGQIDEVRISDTALSPSQFLSASSVMPVPLPSSAWMSGFGLAGVVASTAVRHLRKHRA